MKNIKKQFRLFLQLRVSMKRLNEFFSAQELSEDNDYSDFSLNESKINYGPT